MLIPFIIRQGRDDDAEHQPVSRRFRVTGKLCVDSTRGKEKRIALMVDFDMQLKRKHSARIANCLCYFLIASGIS